MSNQNPHTVCVIGGGMSGLFTGALLAKNGYKVTVLEKNHIIGGGLLSSLFKHSRMDDAESELNQARSALRRYCSKLEGIASPEHINVQPGALLSFADCLCDGFLADVLVQSHIEVARRQLQEAIDAVRTSQRQLRALL